MKINDGGPAFPVECTWDRETGHPLGGVQTGAFTGWQTGLSVRDWFAGQALAGQLAFSPHDSFDKAHMPWDVAQLAYRMADAMLKARETHNE